MAFPPHAPSKVVAWRKDVNLRELLARDGVACLTRKGKHFGVLPQHGSESVGAA
jgi:hypothetical protein